MLKEEIRRTREANPALRVAHFCLGRVNPQALDGMDRTIYYLSRAQAVLGHSVRVFSITNKPPLPIQGVVVSSYQSLKPSRLLFSRRLQDLLCWRSPLNLPRALVADVMSWRPDILHFHGVHMLQHVVLGTRLRRAAIPYCVSVHGMLAAAARRRHRLTKSAAAIWERPFWRTAAFLHALDEEEARDLRSYGASSQIVIAPNGIDLTDLETTPAGHRPEQLSVVPENSLTFLFLGRLDPEQKGLDLLLEAWSEARLGAAARLVLVGPSWRNSRPRLEALASRLGVGAEVVFTGPAFGPEKIDLLRQASVFVHVSRWEGLAFSVLEAAALGRPCLLTAAADPRGRFADTGAAIAVRPTPAEIASGLRSFAQMSASQREAMGSRGRDLVRAEFTWAPVARTLLTAYGKCATTHARS
jgi:glycosyltransferase involved in cell wall biosynthesis